MAQKILVGTRKGLITIEHAKPSGWRIAQTKFLGDPVTAVLSDSRTESIYAALNLGHFGVKLWRTRGVDKNWQECATPVYPPVANTNDTANTASLTQIWCLEVGGKNQAGCVVGGDDSRGIISLRHPSYWRKQLAINPPPRENAEAAVS